MNIPYTINGKKFTIEPWTIKQEKEALLSIGEEDSLNEAIVKYYNILIGNKANLSNQERLYVLLDIKTKIASDSMEIVYTCPRCKQVTESNINIPSAITIDEPTTYSLLFDEYSICIGYGETLLEGIVFINNINTMETITNNTKYLECIDKLNIGNYDMLNNYWGSIAKPFIFNAKCSCLICGHIIDYSPKDEDIINMITTINLKDYYGILTEFKSHGFLISELENLMPFELELITNNIRKQKGV